MPETPTYGLPSRLSNNCNTGFQIENIREVFLATYSGKFQKTAVTLKCQGNSCVHTHLKLIGTAPQQLELNQSNNFHAFRSQWRYYKLKMK